MMLSLLSTMEMPVFTDFHVWVSILTLTFLEIVLGVDNIIFISIVSNKLPEERQKMARNVGLVLAMFFRIGLLLGINWIISLKDPVFTLGFLTDHDTQGPLEMSWKDIILLAGGIFLIFKSTMEINSKMQVDKADHAPKSLGSNLVLMVILQIIMVDMIFSLDSILTAVGLVDNVIIMIIAVVISIGIMIVFAGPISRIINKYPSLQLLALSFLVVIGCLLVAEGLHQHVSKNIIYSCLAFSLTVELLNIRFRKKQEQLRINPDLKNDLDVDDSTMNTNRQ